ncbi:MAG: hypothetical protein K6F95_02395 [Selenomonas sp.]|uniref:tyrosine-type recombinase/integrase n=1 Tax=Selenomonas sp. TaxID=2053611 RepID=UPI0025D07B46|nr:tyrosine-type recombinase/integrase [Selenomonas sp.]MCR5756741.1 hypothetical protein [Selenomonas sp.]
MNMDKIRTIEQVAREKCEKFYLGEARAVVKDLITYMDLADGSDKSKRYIQEIKRCYAKFIISMPLDICPNMVTRKYFSHLVEELEGKNSPNKPGVGKVLVKSFTSFIRRGLYNKLELSEWKDADMLKRIEDESFRGVFLLKYILNESVPVSQMRIIRFESKYHKRETQRLLVFDTRSTFLQDLQVELFFAVKKFNTFVYNHEDQAITRRFEESLGSLTVPTNIMDFNPNTFRQQMLFFYRHTSAEEVGVIKALYLHVIKNMQGPDTPFTIENGMDIGFVSRCDVVKCLEEGYRSIRLSSFKEVPSFDNWLVATDDQTGICGDILRKNRLIQVSFQDISLKYRNICKKWFISDREIVLIERANCLRFIKRFLEELEKRHKKVRPLRDEGVEITFQDITSYLYKDKDDKVSERARASIARFLSYLKHTGDMSVDAACFKYFPSYHRVASSHDDFEDYIPEEDYQILAKNLHEESRKESALPVHKITFALFCIMSLMELRPSSIMALRLSDIQECGNGEYYINVATKTSRSHQKTYSIPPIVYQVLHKVIEYTAVYRENVPWNIKDMLFISPSGKIFSADSINCVMKRVCEKNGIRKYTLRNLRKTYMTSVAQSIRKSGGSAFGLEQLFDHKHLETTFISYIRISKEEIMMTICSKKSIKLEDKVRKNIRQNIEMDAKQLVSDKAGYCQREECNMDGMADCFVCKYFITSLSFYDSFVLKREKIKKMLATEGFGEELFEGYRLILKIIDMYIAVMNEMREA